MPIPTDAEVFEFIAKYGPYRLACRGGCGRQMDGVKELPKDWSDIHEEQSLKDALSTYGDEGDPDPLPGCSVTDWETHFGLCPGCRAVEDEQRQKWKASRRKKA